MWTFGGVPREGAVAVNFGAPGNRRAPNGTLWLDYPDAGSDAGPAPIVSDPRQLETFRHHYSRIEEGDLKWVAASGVRGL